MIQEKQKEGKIADVELEVLELEILELTVEFQGIVVIEKEGNL